MNELIGKTINYIYVDYKKSYLVFIINPEKYYIYEAVGECCTDCWFEDILNPESMMGSPIISVTEKKITTFTDDKKEESYTCMGYTITTPKGITDIEYRSESSPYYSGHCLQRYNNELIAQRMPYTALEKKMTCLEIHSDARPLITDDLVFGSTLYMVGGNIFPHGTFDVIRLKPLKGD